MKFDRTELAAKTVSLWRTIQVGERNRSAELVKAQMSDRRLQLNGFVEKCNNCSQGLLLKGATDMLSDIEQTFQEHYDAVEQKMRLYIIGTGNVGKSTLINALIGKAVAKVGVLPITWRKDVFSPEIQKDHAVIRNTNGEIEIVTQEVAMMRASEEERFIKDGKGRAVSAYNTVLGMKTHLGSEQKQKLKKECEREYHYEQTIDEIRWHTEETGIMSRCQLVDTPGMNQDRGSRANRCTVDDYRKASAILWIIDANTLSSQNSIQMIDEFLSDHEGPDLSRDRLRNKIIIVLNRIDAIGNDDRVKVLEDAKRKFSGKCARVVGISAKDAFNARIKSDSANLLNSNIQALENAINEVFLDKSNDIMRNSQKELLHRETGRAILALQSMMQEILLKQGIFMQICDKLRLELDRMTAQVENGIRQCIDSHIKIIENDLRSLVGYTRNPQLSEVQRVFRADELSSALQNAVDMLYHDAGVASEQWHRNRDYQMRMYEYLDVDIAFDVNIPSVSIKSTPEITSYGRMGFTDMIMGLFKLGERKDQLVEQCRSSSYADTQYVRNELVNYISSSHGSAYRVLVDSFTMQVCEPEKVEVLVSNCNELIGQLKQQPPSITLKDILFAKKAVY